MKSFRSAGHDQHPMLKVAQVVSVFFQRLINVDLPCAIGISKFMDL